MRSLPHPPYGAEYLKWRPRSGINVAMGPTGWDFAKRQNVGNRQSRLVMALPYDESPRNFRWPANENGALIYELGQYDDHKLTEMAQVLLEVGSPFVVALREALIGSGFPDEYFYPEVQYVAA